MTSPLAASTLHAVVSPSVRLRDELLAEVLAGWPGPVQRMIEPDEVDRLVMGLDTPSLFAEPAALVVRCDDRWLKKHAARLLPLAGRPVLAGAMILVAPRADPPEAKGKSLGKALAAAGALHAAAVPEPRAAVAWLGERIARLPRPVAQPGAVAQALVAHVGEDPDGLLAALAVADLYAGDEPLDVAAVDAIVGGAAARPTFEFAAAAAEGKADRAHHLLAAGGGLEPQAAVSAMLGEVRKLLAACDSPDNAEAAAWCGARNPNAMHYVRRRAQTLGRGAVLRLHRAALHAQEQLRRGGVDHRFAVEMMVLHARLITRPGSGRSGSGAR